jgi:hypothetical protein
MKMIKALGILMTDLQAEFPSNVARAISLTPNQNIQIPTVIC